MSLATTRAAVSRARPGLPRAPTGTGIGLRSCHIAQVLAEVPPVPFFELLADNHVAPGGLVRAQVLAVAARWPVTLHCVGMNVAGTDPLDLAYLTRMAALADVTGAAWVSDHLCFTACHGRQFHDLLPIPYTAEALIHVAARVQAIQEVLGRPLVIENVSAYIGFDASQMSEAQFLAELVDRTGCRLLLDVNNLYVNHVNNGELLAPYLGALPLDAVVQLHLAGYEDRGDHLIDAHNNPVSKPVWQLYREVVALLPQVPTLIEWDNDVPAFEVLQDQARKAEDIRRQAQRQHRVTR